MHLALTPGAPRRTLLHLLEHERGIPVSTGKRSTVNDVPSLADYQNKGTFHLPQIAMAIIHEYLQQKNALLVKSGRGERKPSFALLFALECANLQYPQFDQLRPNGCNLKNIKSIASYQP